MSDDKQTKQIKKLIPEGSTYYRSTRCIRSEFPKVAERGAGRGKPKQTKVCANQQEYDDFVGGGTIEPELESLEG